MRHIALCGVSQSSCLANEQLLDIAHCKRTSSIPEALLLIIAWMALLPADLGQKSSKYTEDVAIGALVLGVIVLVYYGATTLGRQPAADTSLEEESAFDSKEEALQRK